MSPSAVEIATLITAVGGVLGVVIAAWRGGVKLKEIHVLTNSNLTQVKSDLSTALLRIDQLESFIHKHLSVKDTKLAVDVEIPATATVVPLESPIPNKSNSK